MSRTSDPRPRGLATAATVVLLVLSCGLGAEASTRTVVFDDETAYEFCGTSVVLMAMDEPTGVAVFRIGLLDGGTRYFMVSYPEEVEPQSGQERGVFDDIVLHQDEGADLYYSDNEAALMVTSPGECNGTARPREEEEAPTVPPPGPDGVVDCGEMTVVCGTTVRNIMELPVGECLLDAIKEACAPARGSFSFDRGDAGAVEAAVSFSAGPLGTCLMDIGWRVVRLPTALEPGETGRARTLMTRTQRVCYVRSEDRSFSRVVRCPEGLLDIDGPLPPGARCVISPQCMGNNCINNLCCGPSGVCCERDDECPGDWVCNAASSACEPPAVPVRAVQTPRPSIVVGGPSPVAVATPATNITTTSPFPDTGRITRTNVDMIAVVAIIMLGSILYWEESLRREHSHRRRRRPRRESGDLPWWKHEVEVDED